MEQTHAVQGAAVGIEVAATDGSTPIPRLSTAQRGLLVIGRRILAERERDRKDGRRHRNLNSTEMRALNMAVGAELH